MQQTQIEQLQNQVELLTQQVKELQGQININSNPEFVKQLLNVVKPQIITTAIATPPENLPSGTLLMQASPAKLSFKSDAGWVALI